MFWKLYKEDTMFGDITTEILIPQNIRAEGKIVAREGGILAGRDYVEMNLKRLSIEVEGLEDGASFEAGEVVLVLRGDAHAILKAERTVINVLGRMTGVATATRRVVEKVRKINQNVRIAATRKTLWGYLDKLAVKIGGGDTHRWNLGDMVMVKDNHLALVSKADLSRKLKDLSFTKKIEIEADTEEQAYIAAEIGADIIMLDNFSPEEVCKLASELKRKYKVLIEVSGGITEENVLDYAKCEVDVISMGSLTHSAKSLNFSMEVERIM